MVFIGLSRTDKIMSVSEKYGNICWNILDTKIDREDWNSLDWIGSIVDIQDSRLCRLVGERGGCRDRVRQRHLIQCEKKKWVYASWFLLTVFLGIARCWKASTLVAFGGHLAASCEGAQRRISNQHKSETMVLGQKRWSTYFGSGTSYYPRWRSSGALGSSLWVRREENRRLTDKLGDDCIESDAASFCCGKKGEMTTKAKQTEVVLSKSSAWHSFLDVFQCDGTGYWILFREAAGVSP